MKHWKTVLAVGLIVFRYWKTILAIVAGLYVTVDFFWDTEKASPVMEIRVNGATPAIMKNVDRNLPQIPQRFEEIPREEIELAALKQEVLKREMESGSWQINVNTATVSQLCELHNVGKNIAVGIVKFRGEYGLFTDKRQLLEVPYFSQARLKANWERIILNEEERTK